MVDEQCLSALVTSTMWNTVPEPAADEEDGRWTEPPKPPVRPSASVLGTERGLKLLLCAAGAVIVILLLLLFLT